ncbi:MAG: hypothetical protein IBX69_17615 [Anaerolineales bacterium]|nr:hypothetical protein [Anaerolineales bacterium]
MRRLEPLIERLVHRRQATDRMAMIGDNDRLSLADLAQVLAQSCFQIPDSDP